MDKEEEEAIMKKFLPAIYKICSNKIRAGIIHMLFKSAATMHSAGVEQLSFKMGIRPSVCIYHLERLERWKLVEVRKAEKHGTSTRRSIWGLNLKYPNWVLECYKAIRLHFFSEDELNEITNKNKSRRKS